MFDLAAPPSCSIASACADCWAALDAAEATTCAPIIEA
jgi:hypothetical protein